jgi:hypothetical protein
MRAPLDDSTRISPWMDRQDATADTGGTTAPAPSTPSTPPDAPGAEGSSPPPSSAGDESPDRSFPVPPVPPPPSPGPIFTLAGGGGGGAASFARPGTEAAKPFRSSIFTVNRSTAAGPMTRFGAGAPVTAGGAPSFLPAGLEGAADAPGAAGGDEELQRILAILRGGGVRG